MRRLLAATITVACFVMVISSAQAAKLPRRPYLVSYDGVVDDICDALEGAEENSTVSHLLACGLWKLRLKCRRRLRLSKAFALHLSLFEVEALSRCVPSLDFLEDSGDAVSRASWALDRINQRALPLDSILIDPKPEGGFGETVHIFILDTGVRTTHVDFRLQKFGSGRDFVDEDDDANDCDGHGSHVASTIAQMAYQGKTIMHSVRVLDCQGNGELSALLEGLEWVGRVASTPAVVSLALGVKAGIWSGALERVVRALTDRGIVVVTASGNQNTDACTISPGNVEETITVAASDQFDRAYSMGNTGQCVDLFAPGVGILGACGGYESCDAPSDTSYSIQSGTSMAVSHAVGIVARILALAPEWTPFQLKRHLISTATRDVIRGALLPNTPNRLVFVK